jgi:hypothetical protein
MSKQPKLTPRSKRPAGRSKREEARAAFLRIAPRLRSFDATEILRPNVSVPRAAAIALAAEPKIAALSKQIHSELPRFRIKLLRDLRPIALATWYAHISPRPEIDEDRVKQLVTEGAPLKRTLLLQAEALADRKLVSADRVTAIRTGRGHLDLANDLVALSQLFREHWPIVSTRVAIIEERELDRAAELGTALLEALGARTVTRTEPNAQQQANDLRWRAFTLLAQTYDEIRAAVAYVRRKEGDAEGIAPSLYSTRTRRRVATDSTEPRSEPPAPPAVG